MSYRIEFSGVAARQFRKLDRVAAGRVNARIDELAANPHKIHGVKQLKGVFKGICRVRAGDFRILYQVRDEIITVLIIAIGNRKDIYG